MITKTSISYQLFFLNSHDDVIGSNT